MDDFDYFVKLIKFPNFKVKECVTENIDGSYTIFINKNLASNQQINALHHALTHVLNDDFKKKSVDLIELNNKKG